MICDESTDVGRCGASADVVLLLISAEGSRVVLLNTVIDSVVEVGIIVLLILALVGEYYRYIYCMGF